MVRTPSRTRGSGHPHTIRLPNRGSSHRETRTPQRLFDRLFQGQVVSHLWTPLTDLTSADRDAASDELPALVATWLEQRERLGSAQLDQFNERLEREWAIETGIIEQIYSLDRGTTQLLIEHGIDASLIGHDDTDKAPEYVAAIISDQKAAVNWLFTIVKQERPLSTSFIKELHALMTGRQTHAEGRD